MSQLDYIEGLGTTAIWLTPAFKNRPVQGSGTDISAGYHGYWITDFTQIDPHLGTNDDLRTLVDEAHARGIKVFFDIITNHTADVIGFQEGTYSYRDKADYPYIRSDTLDPFDDRDYAGTGTFPPLDPEVSFPYTPIYRTVEDETVKVPAWLNDRRYYHNRGDTTFAGESSEYGDFFGLDDLFTEHPDVVDGMTEIYQAWVDFGIDGFRIDTVKHVNVEFWQTFAEGIAAQAEAAGNPDFFAFGEVFDESPAFMSRYTTEAGLQATIDFGFQARAQGFAEGRPTVELRDLFADDDYYTDTDSNAYSLPTFLGNHDMGRIGRFIAVSGASGDELLARDRLVHSLMYLTRGQPVVYYGDEQGFVGDGGDKDARQDMFPSQVATYNDDDLIGTDATTADANFDTNHPLYQHLADLSRLRSEHPALADGAQIHRYASGNAGVYAFSRIDADDEREYLVAVNNSETDQTVTFDTFSERGRFRGLWPAGTGDIRSDSEGRVDGHRSGAQRRRVARHVGSEAREARAGDELPHAGSRRHGRRPSGGRRVGARGRLQPGDARLAPGGHRGLDGARHRRQRAVPCLPRRHRPGQGHARRVPGGPARLERQPVGGADVRNGRGSAAAATPARWWTSRATRRGQRPRHGQRRDGVPWRMAARMRRGPTHARP